MAFFINNLSEEKLCTVKNDEIMVFDLCFSKENVTILNELKDLKPEDAEETPEKRQALAKELFKVNCAAISNCRNFLSASTSTNCLLLWKLSAEGEWGFCSSRSLIRKGQKLIFSNSSSDIIIADRGGDIFQYPVKDYKGKKQFLLGHISLVLDVAISPDDKLLASCDRDSKIRISHYPNAYNILCICLGHQEFVSSVQFVQLSGGLFLLSSSGDGTIRLWQEENNWSEKSSVVLCENDSLSGMCNVSEGDKSDSKIQAAAGDLVSEKQIQFSVRCVKYCSKRSLCLVLSYLKPIIAAFELSQDGSFQFKQLLNLPGYPLDAVLCPDGKLLILVKQIENVLVLFDYSEKQMFVQEVTEKIPQFLREFYHDFSSVDAFPDDFVALFKRCYDTTEEPDSENVKKKKC